MCDNIMIEKANSVVRLPRITWLKTGNVLLIILGISVLLRLGAAVVLGNEVVPLPGTFDQVSYHTLATRVLEGHGFTFGERWWPITEAGAPTAHWSFLYTMYLALVYKVAGVVPLLARLLQAFIVGLVHPYLVYRIGTHCFDRMTGLIAAGLTAIYAYFAYYAGTLMTEPFYIIAVLAVLYLLIRLSESGSMKDALLLGVAVGVAVLLRQLFLLVAIPLFVWLWWSYYRQHTRIPLLQTVAVGVIVALFILPFTLYNYVRFDQFVLLNTNSGYAFFWANHPIYGTHFEPILPPEMGSYEGLIPTELRGLDEAALDKELLDRGLRFVADDPVRYIQLSISRIPAYFIFWPSAESGTVSNVARVASFGLMWPLMLAGVIGVILRSDRWQGLQSPIFLLLLFGSLYTMIHLLSWSLVRYRLPVDAVLLVYAALSVRAAVTFVMRMRLRFLQPVS